jgi:Leucine-rich repeat (LRR) protein
LNIQEMHPYSYRILSTCIIMAAVVLSTSAVPASELDVLRDVQASIDPTDRLGWFSTATPCVGDVAQWQSVFCTNDSVTGISLGYFGLEGTLPNSIGNLGNLTKLYLAGNRLSGTIPQSLLGTKLEECRIEGNLFSSPLPTNFFGMPTLKAIAMDGNKGINETWPTQWSSSITELRVLLSAFSGPLSPSMSNMTNLRILDLSYNPNAMNGSYPSFILNMTSLEFLNLGSSQIKSALPNLCVLSNLTDLLLYSSAINTRFPELSCLTKLRTLSLGNCGITGTIPGNLSSNLRTLNLMDNQLEGEIPVELLGLPWIEFSVSNNRFVN